MITEEILQAYKDGETIRSFFKSDEMKLEMQSQGVSGARYSQTRCKGLDLDFVNRQELLDGDWEIVKEMVPYYPVLYLKTTLRKDLSIASRNLGVSDTKYRSLEQFQKDMSARLCQSGSLTGDNYLHHGISLIKEVPEFIEYREE